METYRGWYQVFKGWYRESSARKGMVWHRVTHVYSIMSNRQTAKTVCGRRIPTTKCDFDMKPDHKCMQCEKSPGVVIESGLSFAPIGSISIRTKADAIHELKRLLKPRIYYLKIWDYTGVRITAKWESDVSVSIYTETETLISKRMKKVLTFNEIQADLGRLKSSIDCLCDASDKLALEAKTKKKLKGKLTETESNEYFEGLMAMVGKK